MPSHALQVQSVAADRFHWVLLAPAEAGAVLSEHSTSDGDFDSYAAALNAGTLALAAADGQPYENEAADPVGDADAGFATDAGHGAQAARGDSGANEQPVTREYAGR